MDGDAKEELDGDAMEAKLEKALIKAVSPAESILTLTGDEDEKGERDAEDKFTQATFCSLHKTFLSLKGRGSRAGKRPHQIDDGDDVEGDINADTVAPRAKRRKTLKRRMGLIAASLGNILLTKRKADL